MGWILADVSDFVIRTSAHALSCIVSCRTLKENKINLKYLLFSSNCINLIKYFS